MMMSHASVLTLEALREASERWVRRERMRPRLTSGLATLDTLLGGGWPQGKVGELVGPASSGRSAVATATVAGATTRGEVVAWLDLADALDPASAAATEVDLQRVLWVRPRGVEEAIRAAELVLEVGGFTVVVLDFGAGALSVGGRRGRGQSALRLRLVRAVERAGTVVVGGGVVRWGVCGEHRWLAGLDLKARVERGGVEHGARAPRVYADRGSRPPGEATVG
jgi:RecA/RadA recombinase